MVKIDIKQEKDDYFKMDIKEGVDSATDEKMLHQILMIY